MIWLLRTCCSSAPMPMTSSSMPMPPSIGALLTRATLVRALPPPHLTVCEGDFKDTVEDLEEVYSSRPPPLHVHPFSPTEMSVEASLGVSQHAYPHRVSAPTPKTIQRHLNYQPEGIDGIIIEPDFVDYYHAHQPIQEKCVAAELCESHLLLASMISTSTRAGQSPKNSKSYLWLVPNSQIACISRVDKTKPRFIRFVRQRSRIRRKRYCQLCRKTTKCFESIPSLVVSCTRVL